MSCDTFVFVLLIVVIAIYLHRFSNGREGFNVDSQNFIYNNKFDNAEMLQYDSSVGNPTGLYQKAGPPIYDASVDFGVNQNSQSDVYDIRGFWTNGKEAFSDVDNFTQAVDNAQLRNKFEMTYMLDSSLGPDNVSNYDISKMPVDQRCCPAQYGVSWVNDNSDFANKYVANNYSGMNYDSKNPGCVCMRPFQANWVSSRGGNGI
jgi:hypothetical protein